MGELQQPRNKNDPPFRRIANNSKSFANGSKSVIRNNVVCVSSLKFALIKTFKNIGMELMV